MLVRDMCVIWGNCGPQCAWDKVSAQLTGGICDVRPPWCSLFDIIRELMMFAMGSHSVWVVPRNIKGPKQIDVWGTFKEHPGDAFLFAGSQIIWYWTPSRREYLKVCAVVWNDTEIMLTMRPLSILQAFCPTFERNVVTAIKVKPFLA